jgi:hypothetical protein
MIQKQRNDIGFQVLRGAMERLLVSISARVNIGATANQQRGKFDIACKMQRLVRKLLAQNHVGLGGIGDEDLPRFGVVTASKRGVDRRRLLSVCHCVLMIKYAIVNFNLATQTEEDKRCCTD